MGNTFSANQKYANEELTEDEIDYAHCTRDAVATVRSRELSSFRTPIRTFDNTKETLKTVSNIEETLDFYEKVSLVYLLYDDEQLALQHLLQIQRGHNVYILLEWAKCNVHTPNWNDKLLEALCIIQNNKIIFELGFTAAATNARFLPLNDSTALFINLTKKKLYRICENLSEDSARHLVTVVHCHIITKELPWQDFDVACMELYLLHWNEIGYISNEDLSNLCKAFEQIGEFDIAEKLEPLCAASSITKKAFNVNLENDNTTNETESVASMYDVSLQPHSSDENTCKHSYYVDSEYPGIVMIINQEFIADTWDPLSSSDVEFNERKGTNYDRDMLKFTFKIFGFEVIIKNNIIHSDMLKDIEDVVNMVEHHSSLIICVLSHGRKGCVYAVDRKPIEIEDILNIMCQKNKSNLQGKPKILIIQSCQGTKFQEENEANLQTDGPGDSDPTLADTLVFWSTVPGYASVRDESGGTWFIQTLCNEILRSGNELHFTDICTLVTNYVNRQKWRTRRMLPIIKSTLLKFFYLPPMKRKLKSQKMAN